METKLIDVNEVARLLHIGARTLWRFRDMGKIPAPIKIGRAVRWRAADISAWIADGCPDVIRTNWQPR